MIVSAASRMFSAISLGVFCRLAPSTIAIMRSRKVSPGLAVTRTTSQSESTRVPPVTALRSPPLSRMTGALSPVMALSSTEATPSMTSPSPGMMSPASTSTTSPLRSVAPGRVSLGGRVRRARPASWPARSRARALRSASAWALPRPSAIASAKLAKSTVNHSHERDRQDEPGRRLAAARAAPGRTARSSARCRPRPRTSPGCAPGAAGRACGTTSTIAPAHDRRGSNSGRALAWVC